MRARFLMQKPATMDLPLSDPKLVAEARAEFDACRNGRVWKSRFGDRKPPLDDRK